jgi:hypothetical protein
MNKQLIQALLAAAAGISDEAQRLILVSDWLTNNGITDAEIAVDAPIVEAFIREISPMLIAAGLQDSIDSLTGQLSLSAATDAVQTLLDLTKTVSNQRAVAKISNGDITADKDVAESYAAGILAEYPQNPPAIMLGENSNTVFAIRSTTGVVNGMQIATLPTTKAAEFDMYCVVLEAELTPLIGALRVKTNIKGLELYYTEANSHSNAVLLESLMGKTAALAITKAAQSAANARETFRANSRAIFNKLKELFETYVNEATVLLLPCEGHVKNITGWELKSIAHVMPNGSINVKSVSKEIAHTQTQISVSGFAQATAHTGAAEAKRLNDQARLDPADEFHAWNEMRSGQARIVLNAQQTDATLRTLIGLKDQLQGLDPAWGKLALNS